MRISVRGLTYILTGVIFIAAAVAWYCHNLSEVESAGDSAQALLSDFEEQLSERTKEMLTESRYEDEDPFYGFYDDPYEEVTQYEKMTVDGYEVFGLIEIPSENIKLPVLNEYELSLLKTAPCRYIVDEDAPQDKVVIAGHNYKTHFGPISNLNKGDEVILTTAAGTVYNYEVVDRTTINAYASDDLKSGDWNLAMFTCTLNGRMRVLVTCKFAD